MRAVNRTSTGTLITCSAIAALGIAAATPAQADPLGGGSLSPAAAVHACAPAGLSDLAVLAQVAVPGTVLPCDVIAGGLVAGLAVALAGVGSLAALEAFGSTNVGPDNTGSFNVGSQNTGSGNVGSQNTGSGNVGSGQTGSGNVGWGQTGSLNAGSAQTGSLNVGSANTGSTNVGSANTGSSNTGSMNTGSLVEGSMTTGIGSVGIGPLGIGWN